jgi:hypothetical protein
MSDSATKLLNRASSGNVHRSDLGESYAFLCLQLLSDGGLVGSSAQNYAQECIDAIAAYPQSAATVDFAQRFTALARANARGN